MNGWERERGGGCIYKGRDGWWMNGVVSSGAIAVSKRIGCGFKGSRVIRRVPNVSTVSANVMIGLVGYRG